ncbi:hypothetical protein MHW47_10065 [Streptomyces sp. OfavH-34-F]|uniref:hypothetical protein n=1 Tax=Streptomyces sp. OfavH-34-F TaxID=2917760 RepID=UPI001EF2B186|nr:hypothetical protein [Streptomyces sp. OfavH-34-F]MCG7524781.1 hypothetical protein [Streptomyces sp. OfavH-34-F]
MVRENSDGAPLGRYPLASAQLQFLFDEIEYPENDWVAIRESVSLPCRLSEKQARNLLSYVCRQSEAVRSRVVKEVDGNFTQEVTGLDHFFAHSFRYVVSSQPQDVLAQCPQPLDAFTRSCFFLVADAPAGAVVYYAAHHAFFDGAATGMLHAMILRAAQVPEILEGRRAGVLGEADGEAVQPRHVRAFEEGARGVRSTRRWLGFHGVPRGLVWSDGSAPSPAEGWSGDGADGRVRGTADGLDLENRVSFALGGRIGQALPHAAARLGISTPSLINSLICGYVGDVFGLREVTLKTICSNRFRPALRAALACLAAEVWAVCEAEDSGRDERHRWFHGELIRAYGSGMYDWDAVRRTANFPSPYRSGQSVSTNITYAKGDRPGPPADDSPVLTLHAPLRVPRVLGHDLAVHAVIGSRDVRFMVKAAAHRMDEAATRQLARGLFDHFIHSLPFLRAAP